MSVRTWPASASSARLPVTAPPPAARSRARRRTGRGPRRDGGGSRQAALACSWAIAVSMATRPDRGATDGAVPTSPAATSRGRTTSTGHGALRTTCSETLPRNSRPTAPRPWLPTITRSTRSASAADTIWSPGSPVQTRNDTSTPSCRPRSTQRLRLDLAPLPDLVDPGPEPAAGQEQRARVDDRHDQQRRPELRGQLERVVGRRGAMPPRGPSPGAASAIRPVDTAGGGAPDSCAGMSIGRCAIRTIGSGQQGRDDRVHVGRRGHDDQDVDHAEHPVGPLDVGQDVAVVRPQADAVRGDVDVPALARADGDRVGVVRRSAAAGSRRGRRPSACSRGCGTGGT